MALVKHPTVELDGVPIDTGIAPLIRLLWDLDIDTISSCQDNLGRVWVEFATPYDAETFLNAVAFYDDDIDSLYNRIRGAWEPDDYRRWRKEHAWWYTVSPVDLSVDEVETAEGEIEEHVTGSADFTFSVSIRFPHSDLEPVMDCLRAAAKQHTA